ncbi:MAG: BolA/IbaG family iron-sulfur metabolism protein, partial [Pseudomonadales bacterium]|nr:BolA/IbaG family iron-sulfur metabolism protein [Pseudomonadales bacterium]
MNEEEIRALIAGGIENCDVMLQAEGNKMMLVLVSEAFEGLSRVKRQQRVYSLLNDKIASGEIHAVSMRCLT